MTVKRGDELLEATAQAFEEMREVGGEFIQENNISFEDCHAWCLQIAAILRGYLAAPQSVQTAILAAGVADPPLRKYLWHVSIQDSSMTMLLKRLDQIKPGQ